MNDDKKKPIIKISNGGISFCGLLAIIFITLKLHGLITWSWWWVLAPLWMPVALVIGILILLIIVLIIASIVASID